MKKTIRTPFRIHLFFLAFLLLPLLFAYGIYEASAKTITDCRTEWNNWFFQQIDPTIQKQCGKKFQYYTRIEIKRMNNFANFK